MKIVKSEGCTAFWTRVDNKNLEELPYAELRTILNSLINREETKSESKLVQIINTILDSLEADECPEGDYCEQCGDTNYQRIFNI